MKVGVIGLGKMGSAVVFRLHKAGHDVFGFDIDAALCKRLERSDIACATSYEELAGNVEVVWLMLPAGTIVDTVIEKVQPYVTKEVIIIDGGNSRFTDSIRRAEECKKYGISYIDCGTSGGLYGQEIGFSLMIGGEFSAFKRVEPIFKAIAMPSGYGYMGPSGAGHYVKMIHNGIEYALMQAYAEGFHLLKEGHYKGLDLAKIADVWLRGSVIRSWLLELTHTIFKHDQEFKSISGSIGGGSTGQWTVDEAYVQNIPVRLIEDALRIRKESNQTGGNYATKLVALLREQFGGHAVKKIT